MPNGKTNNDADKEVDQKDSESQKEKGAANESKEPEQNVLKEQVLRLAAEFDNYKKRIKGDIDGAKGMGRAELMKDLLPIIDEFELALMALNRSDDKNLAKGVEMLYSNLTDILKKDGLAEIPCTGVFDPYRHEIVMAMESKEKAGTIIEVVKKGYMFGSTLLRPASVIVAKDADDKKTDEEK